MADRSEVALAVADEADVPGRSWMGMALGHRLGTAGMKQCFEMMLSVKIACL